jgi:hypothetical protein
MNYEKVLRLTVCPVLILHVQFAETEIAEGDVTGIIEEDVLGLKVTVDDLEAVQAFKRTQQLCSVESGAIDIESLFPLQVVEQLSTIDECQNKIQLFRRLEGEFQRNDERIVDLCQHRSLCQGVGDFGSGDDVSLADRLEGVDPAGIFLPT